MNLTIIIISISIVAIIGFFIIRYFLSDNDPDSEIDKNNTARMLSRYKK